MTIGSAIGNQVVSAYISELLLNNNCILVLRHPDDGHKSDQNMLVKNNNMWLNIVINVHLLVYHIKTFVNAHTWNT